MLTASGQLRWHRAAAANCGHRAAAANCQARAAAANCRHRAAAAAKLRGTALRRELRGTVPPLRTAWHGAAAAMCHCRASPFRRPTAHPHLHLGQFAAPTVAPQPPRRRDGARSVISAAATAARHQPEPSGPESLPLGAPATARQFSAVASEVLTGVDRRIVGGMLVRPRKVRTDRSTGGVRPPGRSVQVVPWVEPCGSVLGGDPRWITTPNLERRGWITDPRPQAGRLDHPGGRVRDLARRQCAPPGHRSWSVPSCWHGAVPCDLGSGPRWTGVFGGAWAVPCLPTGRTVRLRHSRRWPVAGCWRGAAPADLGSGRRVDGCGCRSLGRAGRCRPRGRTVRPRLFPVGGGACRVVGAVPGRAVRPSAVAVAGGGGAVAGSGGVPGSAQAGRATVTVPWWRVMVQWPWWVSMWWRRQSRTRLVRAVGPLSIQEIRWWASQKIGGALHTTQPLSRAFRARRMARLTKRWAMATSRGSELAPSTIGMICASHASRRIAPADSPSPCTRVPTAWAPASVRSLRSMVIVMCAFGPCPASATPRPAAPLPAALPAAPLAAAPVAAALPAAGARRYRWAIRRSRHRPGSCSGRVSRGQLGWRW